MIQNSLDTNRIEKELIFVDEYLNKITKQRRLEKLFKDRIILEKEIGEIVVELGRNR